VQGKADQIVRKLQQDWPETIKVNWVLWIPAQFINFKFVPPNLTVSWSFKAALAPCASLL